MNALRKLTPALFLFLFLIASGCDSLNNEEPEVAAISTEDLEAASSIMGESLSDQNEGMMASLNDMTASLDVQGLSYNSRRFFRDPLSRPCRGVNRESERTYDETTGVHNITYSRTHEAQNCAKTVTVDLNYIFTDADGNFIATPRASAASISEIAFEGSRTGSGTYTNRRGNERTRSYEQTGNWNLSGMLTNTSTLNGTQLNEGDYAYTRLDSTGNEVDVSGTYSIELNTVDVTITQNETEEDLENQITGTLQYTITMNRTINGETEDKLIEGTVELEGNGKALLRFNGLRQLYRISLSDGEVEEEETNDIG